MTEAAGIGYAEALTGFKWVVRAVAPGQRFLFGYEEALGYCVGDLVRDKDGVSAALVAAELAPEVRADGTTIEDRLDELHRRHGVHLTAARSRRIEGADWLARVTGCDGRPARRAARRAWADGRWRPWRTCSSAAGCRRRTC